MNQPYLKGPALHTACAAGSGVIIIVEGETDHEDTFVYKQWFGGRAREVSFFPQNGWTRVLTAVADLRAELPGRRIYGIIDRDFAEDSALLQQITACPDSGVFRLSHYTLENYLLEPVGWLKVAQLLHRGTPPAGWTTEAEVLTQIERAYRACARVGAYNFTVFMEHERLPALETLPYREHPDAVKGAELELARWGATRSTPRPLVDVFQRHLTHLDAMPLSELPRWITGKAVLTVLAQALPTPRNRAVERSILLSLYLDKHPLPPDEIASIVTRIVDHDGAPFQSG